MLFKSYAVIALTVIVLLVTVLYGVEFLVNALSVMGSITTALLGSVVGPGIILGLLVIGICAGAAGPINK